MKKTKKKKLKKLNKKVVAKKSLKKKVAKKTTGKKEAKKVVARKTRKKWPTSVQVDMSTMTPIDGRTYLPVTFRYIHG
jgi:hypothetical protein